MNLSDDDQLEALLRGLAAEHDPVPAIVTTAARAAWELRDLDGQLASLVADSWADASAVGTRDSLGTLRMLTFASDGSSIEVDVEHDPVTGTCRLRGFVTGAVGDLVIQRYDGQVTAPVLDDQFDVDGLSPGPARLSVSSVDGRRITTSWISL